MRELLNELKNINGDGNEGSESAADTATPRRLDSVIIECECDDPEQAKLMLEDMLRKQAKLMLEEMLRSKGNLFSYSKLSKFNVFRLGKLPEF
ncbi:hypothetical protein Tco_1051316, partial [Tanacetum coccineum]